MKILISEYIPESGINRMRKIAEVEYNPDLWRNKQELINKIIDADALVVRNQTIVDQEILDAGKKLKVIGRLGVGLDNINLLAAKQRNVKIVSAKNANSVSVAEYVMAVILTASRSIIQAGEDVKKGNWNRKLFTGNEIYGKTLGLIGTGEIGHRLAKRAIAFGMKVIGYDPYIREFDYPFSETGITKVELAEVLKESDFVSIHVPLTNETRNLLSTKEFNLMKKNAIIINTSRGGIVDESALFKAVESGQIAGAYLDVLENEPVEKDYFLLNSSKITVTPHIAGLTEESQERITNIISDEIMKVLEGKESLFLVSYDF
ncbi:hydroxyacid dehydrogenase [Aeribacillus sp. FSL M8-0235]|uniref:hydroxyacid dehydrogenase n=1 Tax=Aeribacillus sp. FSL M8-0235 TaxID=2954576 RepID=UPI002871E9BB|nr:hydroxyacid dehydrogenase [Aeribacillus pallidus]